MVDDSETRPGANRFVYTGHWEHVKTRKDGRALGTSTRSFHIGDTALLAFSGTQIRLYGVLGKKGGYGIVSLDEKVAPDRPDFYAPAVEPGSLVYVSPVLPAGTHRLVIAVTGQHDAHSGGDYVNIDYAAITTPGAAP
jgi:hypothetical protein